MKNKELKAIKKGDCILTEKPFAYVLHSKFHRERCDYCLKLGKIMKCSNCGYVYYCNRTCQVNAWPVHKIECKYMKKIVPQIIPDAARILCRIILKLKYDSGDTIKSYYTKTNYRQFYDMMSHSKEIEADPKRMEHLKVLQVLLKLILGDELVPNNNELLGLYGRLVTNGFNILDSDMNSIGTGLYVAISIVDHSCEPNAVATFDGITLKMHVTEDMNTLDWSKIFITYIETLETTELRRQNLKNNYYFLCMCPKCLNIDEFNEMIAAACPNLKCNQPCNIEKQKECEKCQTKITNEYLEKYNEVLAFTKSKLDEMKEIASSSYLLQADLDVCRICLDKHKNVLHSYNIWHLKILDCSFESAISLHNWESALNYGPKLIAGYKKYCGDLYPILAILYLKLCKIQILKGLHQDAEYNINEAQKILVITHGRYSDFFENQFIPLRQNLERLINSDIQ